MRKRKPFEECIWKKLRIFVCSRLYPPGSLLHIVRTWTETSRLRGKPGFAAIWTDEEALRELLISPVMVHDHMPAGLIEGLDRVRYAFLCIMKIFVILIYVSMKVNSGRLNLRRMYYVVLFAIYIKIQRILSCNRQL